MGIRFFCPNGHKLNVKTEQAGKTGFCPQCGARVKIPFESTRPSSHHHYSDEESAVNPPEGDSDEELLSSQVPPEPAAAEPSFSGHFQGSAVPPPPQVKEGMWFVQNLNGQNYGPVDTQTIYTWVAELRIAPSTLVWQEGWIEWREARTVFQEFNCPPPVPPVSGGTPQSADDISSLRQIVKEEKNQKNDGAAKRKLLRKKQKAFRDLIMIIALSVVILILAVILLILVIKNDSKKDVGFRTAPSARSYCLFSGQDQNFI